VPDDASSNKVMLKQQAALGSYFPDHRGSLVMKFATSRSTHAPGNEGAVRCNFQKYKLAN